MWVNYDFWFLTGCGYGYEYNFFSKFKSGCQTARKMSSLHGCSRRIRPFQQGTHMKDRHAVAEGGQFFYRGPAPGPPLVPALAEPTIGIYLSVFGIFRYLDYWCPYRYFKISRCRFSFRYTDQSLVLGIPVWQIVGKLRVTWLYTPTDLNCTCSTRYFHFIRLNRRFRGKIVRKW